MTKYISILFSNVYLSLVYLLLFYNRNKIKIVGSQYNQVLIFVLLVHIYLR